MGDRQAQDLVAPVEGLKYAPAEKANIAESLDLLAGSLGQMRPQHCPPPAGGVQPVAADPLGEPMPINKVAALLGCSVWTVRQRLLPSGLPCFRIGRTGKLMFYRNQVVRWVVEKQRQKGGAIR